MGLHQRLCALSYLALLTTCAPVSELEEPTTTTIQTNQPEPTCDGRIPHFEGGRIVGQVCPETAAERGLTILDLSDDWVPAAFRDAPNMDIKPQPYGATYVALANEQVKHNPWEMRSNDRFLELHGILPSFRVIAKRLLDEERHTCIDATDKLSLALISGNPEPYSARPTAKMLAALNAIEQRLRCERVLTTDKKARRWRLQAGLEAFQRQHTIVSRGLLDEETRRTMAEDSRELDFRAALRSLRERVRDATGLLEDGTARGQLATVLGRYIDGDAFHTYDLYQPLEHGAPDLISPATEAAARALGWFDAHSLAEFFRSRGADATERLLVAVKLPPPPAYHKKHMELRAEIDRGDVWYDLPGRRGRIKNRPTLTLYTTLDNGQEIALVRWPTTIGGWKKEKAASSWVGLRYKNSDVGPRLWRDLVVSPAWIPPNSTPPRTIVRRVWGQGAKWAPDTELTGPGYASAYGLVMLVHHQRVERKGVVKWWDNGIRTHGTVGYRSVMSGESHGCHRLFNHYSVRLASFLIQHRNHVRHGLIDKPFTRAFSWRGPNHAPTDSSPRLPLRAHATGRGQRAQGQPARPLQETAALDDERHGPIDAPQTEPTPRSYNRLCIERRTKPRFATGLILLCFLSHAASAERPLAVPLKTLAREFRQLRAG